MNLDIKINNCIALYRNKENNTNNNVGLKKKSKRVMFFFVFY